MVGRDSFIAVYMMSNRRHGTIYIGVTSDLLTRVKQHRSGEIDGFTSRYGLTRLVWYGAWESISEAIHREKALKRYKRDWKVNLIDRENPTGMISIQGSSEPPDPCQTPGKRGLDGG